MGDQDDVVKCPFCEGHGELRRTEIIDRLTGTDLPELLEIYLAELTKPAGSDENSTPGGNGAKPRDFFQEVRSWNPKLPIWRRSPKE
ncbi:MAG TPA: hypothetical protein VJX16_15525 [Terriglobales bacterium]|nr:hypothetical protein [Terriglobales bacterium]